MTVGPGGRVGGGGYVVGVAHNDFDADAAELKAARNYAAEFHSTYNLDKGVDAEAWALNDGVDLGGSLETYQRQEPGLGQQMQANQVRQIQVAATHRL